MKWYFLISIITPISITGSALDHAAAQITIPSQIIKKKRRITQHTFKKIIYGYTAASIMARWHGITASHNTCSNLQMMLPGCITHLLKKSIMTVDILYILTQAYILQKIIDGISTIYELIEPDEE